MTTGFDDESIAEQDGDASQDSDGAGGFFDKASSAVFGLDQASSFNKQAHDIKESADNGSWAISEEGMNEYQKVCDLFLHEYEKIRNDLTLLSRRVKLGSSPYAYTIADFNVTVATGDEKSLVPNLELMKDGYEKLREALEIAHNNYDENEDSVVQQLGKLTPQ